MNVEDLYQEIILDHYRERHHSGLREPFGAEVHHVNPSCGDEITLRVALAGDEIADISYDAVGCSISQASTSVMADLLIGRDIDDAMALYDEFLEMMNSRGQATPDEDRFEDAIAFVGVSQFPARVKCALLGWAATRDAVARAQTAETQSSEAQTAETQSAEAQSVDTQTGETRAATTDLPTPPQEAS